MSKIVIVPRKVARRTDFVSKVRKVTGQSISGIKTSIDTPSPLIECVLFMNDHEENARQLEDLLAFEDDGIANFQIYELMPEESFDDCRRTLCEIDAEVLRGILDKHAYEREKLDKSGDRPDFE